MPIRKITLERAATDKPKLGTDFIDSSFALDSSEAIQLLGFNPSLGVDFVDSVEAKKLITGDKGLVYNNTTGVMNIDSANVKQMFTGDKGLAYDNSTGVFNLDSANVISFTRESISGDKGLAYNNTTGVFNLDSANVKSIFGTDNKGLVYNNGIFNVDSANIKSFTVADAINDGTTTIAPSQNAVFDALALKADASSIPTLGNNFVDSAESRKLIEGNKGLVYNNTTGVMDVDSANLTVLARTSIDPTTTNKGIVYNSTTGAIQVDSSNISSIADARIANTLGGNVTITGNLTVNGTTTTVNSNTVNIGDNIIVLNSDATGAASQDAGIEVERGSDTNVVLKYDEALNRWRFTNDGVTYQDVGGSGTGITGVDITAGTGLTGTVATTSGDHTQTLNVDVGTSANKIVQLDGTAKLPAVDGSQLTNLPAASTAFTALTDTPANFTGAATKIVRVNAAGNALEYLTDTTLVDADFSSAGLMKTDGAGNYSLVTDASANWNTAFGWGDHSTAGYLTSQTSHADVLVDGDFSSAGIMTTNGSGTYTVITDNSSNWNTAFGWGNHASAGYLTGTLPTLGNDFVDSAEAAKIPETEFSVTTANGGVYKFTGDGFPTQSGDNPHIYFTRGKKYVINNSSYSAHPLYIKTVGGAGTGNQYTSGVTGQGSVKVTFEVPMDAPRELFYQCSIHAAMQGKILISDPGYGPDSADVGTLADARIAAASINDLSDVNTAGASSGQVLKWSGSAWTAQADNAGSGGLANVVDDTTPQLGGNLDVNGSKIVSTSGGDIDIEPDGTGDVLLGNFKFDADQSFGASEDNYVLTYDHSGGKISLEASAGGGGGGSLNNIVEDTTPQLGGSLDVNGQKIVSVSGGDIDIEPNGTGDVLLGNFKFDADQTVGSGQDNYVLTYDHSSGKISLEAASGGGGGSAITIQEEGSSLSTAASTINFVGAGVTATGSGATKTITIGTTIATGNIAETFTGNGSDTAFTLTNSFTTNSAVVFYNGQHLTPTSDYAISGQTLTFTFTPVNGSELVVRNINAGRTKVDTFTANGSDTAFTTTNVYSKIEEIMVFVNGSLLVPTTDYTFSAPSTVTFTFTPTNNSEIAVRGSGENAILANRFTYVATASQTAFTGNDAGGATMAFTADNIDVYLNGSKLSKQQNDYSVSGGNTVTLTTGAALNDILEVVVMDPFETANVLQTTNNLSDLPNAATARTNLDVISLTTLKAEVAASADFAAFKARIAAL